MKLWFYLCCSQFKKLLFSEVEPTSVINRPGPIGLDPARPGHDTIWQLIAQMCWKIRAENFYITKVLPSLLFYQISCEVIVFFAKTDFCNFYVQLNIISREKKKNVWRPFRISLVFIIYFINIILLLFSSKFDRFSPYFFGKIGRGWAYYGWLI